MSSAGKRYAASTYASQREGDLVEVLSCERFLWSEGEQFVISERYLAPGMALTWILPLCALVVPLLIVELEQLRSGELEPVIRLPLALRSTVYGLVILTIALIGEDGGEAFIYFQF